jgi:DNA-binding CsgD family transcriptional regulator
MDQDKQPAVMTVAAGLMIKAGLNLEQIEALITREVITLLLIAEKGNQSKVAKRLAIHRNTLLRKMQMLGITSDHRHWKELKRANELAARNLSASVSAEGLDDVVNAMRKVQAVASATHQQINQGQTA